VPEPPRDGPILRLDRVHKSFGAVTALADLSLQVGAGDVVGLLGHNGAGKTTTVRLLAGLLAPQQGTVRVGGGDPVADGPGVRAQMGVLPAALVVDSRLTARQNLRFAADVFGVPEDGLDERIDRMLAVSLARVLLPDPSILLLDEPTSALDPVAARQVRRALSTLAQERSRTIVLCTHDLAEAELLCDRVVVLEEGRVVADGRPVDLAAEHGTGGIQVEVATPDIARARALLADASPGEVDRDGNGRLRTTGIPRDTIPDLVARLVAADLTIYEVRRLDPSLEDVYLALHASRRGRMYPDPDPATAVRA